MELSKHRTVAMMQIIKAKQVKDLAVELETIVQEFTAAGINVGSGAHLKTLMTPLKHLGLVEPWRSTGKTRFRLTSTGKEILAKALRP